VILEANTLKINYFNYGFIKKLGYKAQEIPHLVFAALTPDYAPAELKTLLNRNEYLQKIIRYRHNNGKLVALNTHLQFIVEPKHWIIAMMCELDSNEHHDLQATYQTQNTFLINMGHKLRTPLHAILGYTQLLTRDRQLSSRQHEKLEAILRNSQQLLSMMEDIITFSKIENQRLSCEVTHFPLKELLKDVVETFRLRAQQKGLLFLYQELSHLPTIVAADEQKLQQSLIYLLDNAIEFTAKGNIIFKVGYHHQEVRFQIEDSGIGIAPEEIEAIFLPFYQICQEKTSPQGGSGLGLSIANKLISLLGGQLYFNSVLGQGSIFGFTLALPDVVTPIASTPPPTPYLAQAVNIVVVQSAAKNNEHLLNLLDRLGFNVKISQFDTLELNNIQPQLFFIDVPHSHPQLLEQLKQRYPQSIRIGLLDSAFDETYQQITGYDHILIQPVTVEQLFACLPATARQPLEHHRDECVVTQPYSVTAPGPSPQQAQTLYELAQKGDINGIFTYVNRLETAQDKLLIPFINHIKNLAYHLEEEKICELAQYYMDKAP